MMNAVGPKTEAMQGFFDDVKSGKKIPTRHVDMLYKQFSANVPHPDLDKQMEGIKASKESFMKGVTEGTVDYKFLKKFFLNSKAHMEKEVNTPRQDDLANILEEYVKKHLKGLNGSEPSAFSKDMAVSDRNYEAITQRHSGGPVFRDGLHNLQKGEFVVPKHFGEGGIVSGSSETTRSSNSNDVVGRMEDAFDDFILDLETVLDGSKIAAPEFPDLIIGNLDEVSELLELTAPDIPDIKIEDIDKLTSISIDGLEGLSNIPDRISVEVAGSVDTSTGDTAMTDTITRAINDALREANVGADGRDDLAEVFSKIHDDILGINGRVTDSVDSIEVLNKDINDLEYDYKSHKSEMITTGNELRTSATDLNNDVKGNVRINKDSINDLTRELLMIKTRMASSESGRIIG